MLKTVKTSPPPKFEAEYPQENEINVLNDQAPAVATQSYSEIEPSIRLSQEMNKRVENDSILIRGCIENFLRESERPNYDIEIRIRVLQNGKIGEIKLVRTTHQSSDLESCIYDIIKGWTFSDNFGEGTVVQKFRY
jgi:hypothetical protein